MYDKTKEIKAIYLYFNIIKTFCSILLWVPEARTYSNSGNIMTIFNIY